MVLECRLGFNVCWVRNRNRHCAKAEILCNARGAILVDEHMRTSKPDIYAVGDAIAVTNFVTKQEAYIPLAGPAQTNKGVLQPTIYADAMFPLKEHKARLY